MVQRSKTKRKVLWLKDPVQSKEWSTMVKASSSCLLGSSIEFLVSAIAGLKRFVNQFFADTATHPWN
jgi:hypothetical protein